MGNFISNLCRFLAISGVGWCIDFGIYTLLTGPLRQPVALSNYLSSIPAITFVFFVSTRKTFICRPDGLTKTAKYLFYVLYQLVLVSCVSFLAQWLAGVLPGHFPFLAEYAKLSAKVVITPITILCNYFVLKILAEKL